VVDATTTQHNTHARFKAWRATPQLADLARHRSSLFNCWHELQLTNIDVLEPTEASDTYNNLPLIISSFVGWLQCQHTTTKPFTETQLRRSMNEIFRLLDFIIESRQNYNPENEWVRYAEAYATLGDGKSKGLTGDEDAHIKAQGHELQRHRGYLNNTQLEINKLHTTHNHNISQDTIQVLSGACELPSSLLNSLNRSTPTTPTRARPLPNHHQQQTAVGDDWGVGLLLLV